MYTDNTEKPCKISLSDFALQLNFLTEHNTLIDESLVQKWETYELSMCSNTQLTLSVP